MYIHFCPHRVNTLSGGQAGGRLGGRVGGRRAGLNAATTARERAEEALAAAKAGAKAPKLLEGTKESDAPDAAVQAYSNALTPRTPIAPPPARFDDLEDIPW